MRFEQISDENLNKKNKLTVFNCFIIIIFLFCVMKMEYSVFKVEKKKDGRRNLFGTGRFT